MNIVKILLTVLCILMFSPSVYAEDEKESAWLFEAMWTHYNSRDSKIQQSLNGKEFLVITPATQSGFGAYGFTYHDEEFHNYFVGGTYEVTNDSVGYIQFGLGIGKAVFKDYDSFFTWNPWIYWQKEEWTTNLYFEYIPTETGSSKLFWKVDAQRSFGKEGKWFAGIYGERWMGYGPKAGYSFDNGLSVWLSKPFNSDNQFIAAVSWSF